MKVTIHFDRVSLQSPRPKGMLCAFANPLAVDVHTCVVVTSWTVDSDRSSMFNNNDTPETSPREKKDESPYRVKSIKQQSLTLQTGDIVRFVWCDLVDLI